ILALPASDAITDWIAQIAKAIASAPHRTMIHKAVIEFSSALIGQTEPRPAQWNCSTLGGRPPQIGADMARLSAGPSAISLVVSLTYYTGCSACPTHGQYSRGGRA